MAQVIVAGNPANEFEKTVTRTLSHLSDEFLVLTNVVLPGYYNKLSNVELDVILIGPHAIYAIETKYWQGEVHGHLNQKNWVIKREGNSPHVVENPLQRSEMKAKTLNTFLSRWNSGLMGKLPIRAMVVLPPNTPTFIDNPSDVDVVGLEDLLPRILNQARTMNEEATHHQVELISQHLVGNSLPSEEGLPFENYRVLSVIKRTPRAVSYKAVNAFTERQVFIKRFIADINQPEGKLALWKNRAVREARATSRLSHPNVVAILDVLEDQGNIYIISEWISGWPLSDRIGGLEISTVLDLMIQACRGLEFVHQNFVIHRNISPSCLLIAGQSAKITNFSYSRIEGDPSIAYTEMIDGRDEAYVAPELFSGASKVNPASDVYSLGATLYHVLTGSKPNGFLSRQPLIPPGELNPKISNELAACILDAMQAMPSKRIPTAAALAERLESLR
ncbi:MAG TPA: protein kinase [Chroococcales cyanobacterium]|jgi:tRNA A-37 threonylcarbamoyl transferase component Bud32